MHTILENSFCQHLLFTTKIKCHKCMYNGRKESLNIFKLIDWNYSYGVSNWRQDRADSLSLRHPCFSILQGALLRRGHCSFLLKAREKVAHVAKMVFHCYSLPLQRLTLPTLTDSRASHDPGHVSLAGWNLVFSLVSITSYYSNIKRSVKYQTCYWYFTSQ